MNIVLGDTLLVVALALAPMVATAAEALVIEKHH